MQDEKEILEAILKNLESQSVALCAIQQALTFLVKAEKEKELTPQ